MWREPCSKSESTEDSETCLPSFAFERFLERFLRMRCLSQPKNLFIRLSFWIIFLNPIPLVRRSYPITFHQSGSYLSCWRNNLGDSSICSSVFEYPFEYHHLKNIKTTESYPCSFLARRSCPLSIKVTCDTFQVADRCPKLLFQKGVLHSRWRKI